MSGAAQLEMSVGVLVALWAARVLAALVVLCTLLPFVRTGWWLVRACDFPRLQLALLCLAPLLAIAAIAWRYGWNLDSYTSVAVLVVAFGWQMWHVIRYTPLWPVTVPSSGTSQIRLLAANLDYGNARCAEVIEALSEVDPDVLLLIELDDRWRRELASVRASYDHHVEAIREHGLGIALWSRCPMEDERIEHLVTKDRPSVRATLRLRDRVVHFVGLHPTPPGLPKAQDVGRHDSRIRDAELVLVAKDVAGDPEAAWIVAGDFNDVAWSHTTRLFERLSGLNDPRVGRGMYNTYHAEYPLLRYPLDHVFVSSGMRVCRLDRATVPGSDHFAIIAELDTVGAVAGVRPTADREDRVEGAKIIGEGEKAAREQGRAKR